MAARSELSGRWSGLICADLVRPSLSWLVAGAAGKPSSLTRTWPHAATRTGSPGCASVVRDRSPGRPAAAAALTLPAQREILAAKGGTLADITVGDVLELMDREAEMLQPAPTRDHRSSTGCCANSGVFGDDAPPRLRAVRAPPASSPRRELVDRYRLDCRPIRDLLVDYLGERQPALDYTSLKSLAYYLAQRFWADLEQPSPRHRQPAPARRRRRRVEAAAAHQAPG